MPSPLILPQDPPSVLRDYLRAVGHNPESDEGRDLVFEVGASTGGTAGIVHGVCAVSRKYNVRGKSPVQSL